MLLSFFGILGGLIIFRKGHRLVLGGRGMLFLFFLRILLFDIGLGL